MVHLSAVAALCRQGCSTVSAPALDRFQRLLLPPTPLAAADSSLAARYRNPGRSLPDRVAHLAGQQLNRIGIAARPIEAGGDETTGPGCHRCRTRSESLWRSPLGTTGGTAPASAGVGYTSATQQSYLDSVFSKSRQSPMSLWTLPGRCKRWVLRVCLGISGSTRTWFLHHVGTTGHLVG
jgi:hypothetical protein